MCLLLSCLHPRVVVNPYTHQRMTVPCNQCAGCRSKRQAIWKQRLQAECQCWPYTAFVTLTYSEDACPRFVRDIENQCYVDPVTGECADYSDLITTDKDFQFLCDSPELRVLRKRDVQNFMKRLRKILYTNIPNNEYNKVRFYAIGEYGETTLRPHYHLLLWFSSKWFARHLEKVISSAWSLRGVSLGITDASFVCNDACGYVTSYTTGHYSLPQIYGHKIFRPFSLCSKCPPLGSLFVDEQEVQRMFYFGDCQFRGFPKSISRDGNVPIWRSVQDSIFPRIKNFDALSHECRVQLYGVCRTSMCDEFDSFREWAFSKLREETSFFGRYFCSLFRVSRSYSCLNDIPEENVSLIQAENSLKNLWYVSSRVCTQSAVFGVSIDYYVTKIEDFYSNKSYSRLCKWFEFQQEFAKSHDIRSLLYVDPAAVERLKSFRNETSLLTLKSFGYDSFSDLDNYDFESSVEFKSVEYVYNKIVSNTKDKKARNDYLQANKEKFINIYNYVHHGKYIPQ